MIRESFRYATLNRELDADLHRTTMLIEHLERTLAALHVQRRTIIQQMGQNMDMYLEFLDPE